MLARVNRGSIGCPPYRRGGRAARSFEAGQTERGGAGRPYFVSTMLLSYFPPYCLLYLWKSHENGEKKRLCVWCDSVIPGFQKGSPVFLDRDSLALPSGDYGDFSLGGVAGIFIPVLHMPLWFFYLCSSRLTLFSFLLPAVFFLTNQPPNVANRIAQRLRSDRVDDLDVVFDPQVSQASTTTTSF